MHIHRKPNQGLEAPLDKLVDRHHERSLYSELRIAFVNKMYFLQHGISICACVGQDFFFTSEWAARKKRFGKSASNRHQVSVYFSEKEICVFV